MRITTKGQVTIPIDIRERFGFHPHTEVAFEVDGNTVRLRKSESTSDGRGQRLLQRMRGKATVSMSTDEIMALTRGEG